MSWFGFVLILATVAGTALSGLPAFVVLVAVAVVGASIGVVSGAFTPNVLSALPFRLVGLLESDILQALPLYVLMGALLNRLPIIDAVFRTLVALLPRKRSGPLASGMIVGALLGPINGSVGAGVFALSRSVAPRLTSAGIPAATRNAATVVASTLGIVVPPSLVLILLGDAMLTAHTIAINATGRTDRAINTQDIFHAALVPAGLFLLLSILVAWIEGTRIPEPSAAVVTVAHPSLSEAITAALSVAFIGGLLAGVSFGYFYAVEAAAMGAFALFVAGVLSGRLSLPVLHSVLKDVMATTGALFALLAAATTLTLVLRAFGTDRLLDRLIGAIPGGPVVATAGVLLLIGASAFALDAFEIIFVIVPITISPLLVRVPDAVWVSVLVLLALQASFMLPPFGYALVLVRGILRDPVSMRATIRALAPYLAAQAAVLGAVLAFPALVHFGEVAAGPRSSTPTSGQGGLNQAIPVAPPQPFPEGAPRF